MTLKAAKQKAKELRQKGASVKIYKRAGIYTQPGKGIVSFYHYFVR